MRTIKTILWAAFVAIVFTACNGGSKTYQDAESLGRLKKELIDKFGKDAYYTNFNVVNTDNNAMASVTVTKNPSSLKMEEWINVNGSWKQNSDITLEVSPGAKPENFMFQLDKIMNIDLLGRLIEQAKQKVITDKKIPEVTVKSISLNAPEDGNFSITKYFITIEPKQGGTSFGFWYNLDGTLDKFDY